MVQTRSQLNYSAIPATSLGLDPPKKRAPRRAPANPAPAASAPKRGVKKTRGRGRGRGGRGGGRGRGGRAAPAPAPAAEPAEPAAAPVAAAAPAAAPPAAPPATPACSCALLRRRVKRRDHTIRTLEIHIGGLEDRDIKHRKLIRVLHAKVEAETAGFNAANAVIRGLGGTEVQPVEPRAVEEPEMEDGEVVSGEEETEVGEETQGEEGEEAGEEAAEAAA